MENRIRLIIDCDISERSFLPWNMFACRLFEKNSCNTINQMEMRKFVPMSDLKDFQWRVEYSDQFHFDRVVLVYVVFSLYVWVWKQYLKIIKNLVFVRMASACFKTSLVSIKNYKYGDFSALIFPDKVWILWF